MPLAALCLVPLALFAVRRRWAALVLGGTFVVLAVLLVRRVVPAPRPTRCRSRRRGALAGFLPLAFAFAGGAAVLSRVLSWAVLPLALAAGIALEWAWPGDFGYRLEEGGPALPVWIALGGSLVAIVLGFLLRSRLPMLERADWVPAAALRALRRPDGRHVGLGASAAATQELSPALVAALRANTEPGDVVLSDPETSYWIAAYAPVYVAVSAPTHVGDTKANRPYERVEAWEDFLATGELPRPATTGSCSTRKRAQQLTCAPQAVLGRSLHALREHAEAVAKQVEPRPRDLLDRAEPSEEARPPLAAQDAEAALLEHARHVLGVAQADVRRVLREHEVALLHPLDQVARVRRVHRERPAGDEHAAQLRTHREEDVVADVLDEVGGDGLVEARVVERKRASRRRPRTRTRGRAGAPSRSRAPRSRSRRMQRRTSRGSA